MSVSGRQVALAVQTMLQTATGRSCGYGTAPTTASVPTGNAIPCCVLYELGQVAGLGPVVGDSDADVRVLLQVSSVGQTAEQASLQADKARQAFLARVPGSGQYLNAITVTVTRCGPVAGPEVLPNSAPKRALRAAPPIGVHCPDPRHAVARLNVRPRRPDRSAAHRHERAAGRAVTVTPGCNCCRILRAADRREMKSPVGGVASRRQRECDERPEPGFRVDESILAQRPVHLLPSRRGDPELGLEL